MNPLDELLSSTGRVPGITPRGLRNARTALDAAIAGTGTQQNATMHRPGARAGQPAVSRWWSGLRGKVVAGVAVASAAAAAATVIVLPSLSPHPGTSGLADPASPPTATGTAAPGTDSEVTYTIGRATTNVTAAYALQKAATAAASLAGNEWPEARYWHTEVQSTNPRCPGQVIIANTWTDRAGNGVGEDTTIRAKSSNPMCGNGIAKDGKPYRIINPAITSPSIGMKTYTWSQLAALPTDPARLGPIVRASEQFSFTSDPGLPGSDQSQLFLSIWSLLTSTPVSPALRKALYEVTAQIPGVTVAGTYSDSLGRTGTALHIGRWTMVVDTSNGQVLAFTSSGPPVPTGCASAGADAGYRFKCAFIGGGTSVYISAGAASAASVPNVPS